MLALRTKSWNKSKQVRSSSKGSPCCLGAGGWKGQGKKTETETLGFPESLISDVAVHTQEAGELSHAGGRGTGILEGAALAPSRVSLTTDPGESGSCGAVAWISEPLVMSA